MWYMQTKNIKLIKNVKISNVVYANKTTPIWLDKSQQLRMKF
jgi:hypothetical protein